MAVTRQGPPIGTFRELPIPAYIITDDGKRHRYVSTTQEIEDPEGSVELSKLRPDECVIFPGLIYRLVQ